MAVVYLWSLSLQLELLYSNQVFFVYLSKLCLTKGMSSRLCFLPWMVQMCHCAHSFNYEKFKLTKRARRKPLWGNLQDQQLSAVICDKEIKLLFDSTVGLSVFKRCGTRPR